LFYFFIFLYYGEKDLLNYNLKNCILNFRLFFVVTFLERKDGLLDKIDNFIKKYEKILKEI
jgi:hypothetical protein